VIAPVYLVAGAVAASMLAYAAFGARRDADAAKRHFLLGVGDFFIHWFMWLLGPIERVSIALGWAPDVFNFIGLGFGALSGVFLARGDFVIGAWMILAGGVCDILDGRVARRTQRVSTYGAFLDSSLDRFVEVFAFLGLVVYFGDRPIGSLAASAAMAGSLLVSYTRARGESVGVVCKEGLMQRAERLVLMTLSGLLDGAFSRRTGWPVGTLMLWCIELIAVATFATAAYRTWWISVRLKRTP
jgi:CDP-diacylglycerol---glycerol-3-phosphate 3-phosphatidyltransferase